MTNYGIGGDASAGDGWHPRHEADPYSLTIKRPHSGTEIEIADTANAGDDDPKFVDQMADLGMHGDFADTACTCARWKRMMTATWSIRSGDGPHGYRRAYGHDAVRPLNTVAGPGCVVNINPKTTDG